MKLIVGLGNYDLAYKNTRHNFGHLLVDSFAQSHDAQLTNHATDCHVAVVTMSNERVAIARTHTLMNVSGPSVVKLLDFFKLEPTDLILCYDELDMPFGTIRVSRNETSGGHNGVQSVLDHISGAFSRVRLGIGPKVGDGADFVLHHWSQPEQEVIPEILQLGVETLDHLIATPDLTGDFSIQKNP